MAVTLNSVTGKNGKKKVDELEVANKYNKLQELENKRMKRKRQLAEALNKIHDPDIA
jgi:hypothetical protein